MKSLAARFLVFPFSCFLVFAVLATLLIPHAAAQVVEIPDPNLRQIIRDALNLPSNTPITQQEMLKLERLDAGGGEHLAQHVEVARVLLLDPHRREHGVGIGLEITVALGGEAAAHEAERHDREERVALVGHAVAPGEARQVHSVVGGLGGHIARRRIAGLLEHTAQKHRLPGDLRTRALGDAGHLRVGEIGGRRTDIEPEFKAFRHGGLPVSAMFSAL